MLRSGKRWRSRSSLGVDRDAGISSTTVGQTAGYRPAIKPDRRQSEHRLRELVPPGMPAVPPLTGHQGQARPSAMTCSKGAVRQRSLMLTWRRRQQDRRHRDRRSDRDGPAFQRRSGDPYPDRRPRPMGEGCSGIGVRRSSPRDATCYLRPATRSGPRLLQGIRHRAVDLHPMSFLVHTLGGGIIQEGACGSPDVAHHLDLER